MRIWAPYREPVLSHAGGLSRRSPGWRQALVFHLCSDHIHRAWQLAQNAMDKKFPTETLRVRSIRLHQVQRAWLAEAAS